MHTKTHIVVVKYGRPVKVLAKRCLEQSLLCAMKFFNLAFISAFPGANVQNRNSHRYYPLGATSLTNVVNLNVGGVKYSLFDEDIRKHPGSFFEKALESNAGNKELNIERDGEMFKFVNAFIVNGQLPRNSHGNLELDASTIEKVKSEADYFGLPALKYECSVADKHANLFTSVALRKTISDLRRDPEHFMDVEFRCPVLKKLSSNRSHKDISTTESRALYIMNTELRTRSCVLVGLKGLYPGGQHDVSKLIECDRNLYNFFNAHYDVEVVATTIRDEDNGYFICATPYYPPGTTPHTGVKDCEGAKLFMPYPLTKNYVYDDWMRYYSGVSCYVVSALRLTTKAE